MTILGYDIDGQPLRAGDRVVIVDGCGSMSARQWRGRIGEQHIVAGAHYLSALTGKGVVTLDGLPGEMGIGPYYLRKLPPKQSDNETTTWESIEQLTGWVPEGVRV